MAFAASSLEDTKTITEPFPDVCILIGFASPSIAYSIYQNNSAKALEQNIFSNTSNIDTIKIRYNDLNNNINSLMEKHHKNDKGLYSKNVVIMVFEYPL